MSAVLDDRHTIGASPCARCHVCGGAGEVLYRGLRDRLFGAAGSWDLKRCLEKECGLVWLDPMPSRDEIWKAYANYHTHRIAQAQGSGSLRHRIVSLIEQGYWARKYGYPHRNGALVSRMAGCLLYLAPIRRRESDARVRCLPALAGGRLLDIGCGAGEWLLIMQRNGWRVEGLDFDRQAVDIASARGLKVHCGSLEEQRYPDCSFDAVSSSHVIEHLPDPMASALECARILKPGGKLALITPNNASLTHRLFRSDWRGLEPPRHLHVFSPPSLRRLLLAAGFASIELRPLVASSMIRESLWLREARPRGKKPAPHPADGSVTRALRLLEYLAMTWNNDFGDCVIAVAEKPSRRRGASAGGRQIDIETADAGPSAPASAA